VPYGGGDLKKKTGEVDSNDCIKLATMLEEAYRQKHRVYILTIQKLRW
jgi:hypothetical protein